MSKRALIGDIHLHEFFSDLLDKDGLPQRLSIIIKSLEYIISECKKRNVLSFDIAGDLFDSKNIMYTVSVDEFSNFLIRHKDCHFTIISGNHDLSSVGDNQKSAIEVFAPYKNVTCIPYELLQIENILYVPFSNNFLDIIKESNECDILISHIGINEGVLQSGLSRIDKVTMRDLSKFKLVLLGHYHLFQQIKNERTTLYYAGSISHRDWNDKNQQKNFLIYDTQSLEVEVIPITGFPEYKEFIINSKEEAKDILVEAEKAKNFGHNVRVRKMFDGEMEAPSDLIILEKTKDVDVTNRGIDLTQTDDVKLRNYLRIKGIPEDQHDEYIKVLHDNNIV